MVGTDVFDNWVALEEILIKAPTGETKTHNVFAVDTNKNNGNLMQLQVSDGSVESELLLVQQEYQEHDVQYWRSLWPQPIPTVGLLGGNSIRSEDPLCHRTSHNIGSTTVKSLRHQP